MSNSGGVIGAPVRLGADVYAVLGMSRGGGCRLQWACKDWRVNRRSRRKPYNLGGSKGVGDEELRAWNYGMWPVAVGEPGGWEQPEVPEVCRLGDFEGYNHGAGRALRGEDCMMPMTGTVLPLGEMEDFEYSVRVFGERDDEGGAVELGPWDFYDRDYELPLGLRRLTMVLCGGDGKGTVGARGYFAVQDGMTLDERRGLGESVGQLSVWSGGWRRSGVERMLYEEGDGSAVIAVGLLPEVETNAEGRGESVIDLSEMTSLDMWGEGEFYELHRFGCYSVRAEGEMAEWLGSEYIPAVFQLDMDVNGRRDPKVMYYFNRGLRRVFFHCEAPLIRRMVNMVDCNEGCGALVCTVTAECEVWQGGRRVGSGTEVIGRVDMNGHRSVMVPVADDADGRPVVMTVGVDLGSSAVSGEFELRIWYRGAFWDVGSAEEPHYLFYRDVDGRSYGILPEGYRGTGLVSGTGVERVVFDLEG